MNRCVKTLFRIPLSSRNHFSVLSNKNNNNERVNGPYTKYVELVEKKILKEDKKQIKLLKTLEKVRSLIQAFDFSIFEKNSEPSQSGESTVTIPSRLRGVYIFGPVGSGKSMLMDMFYDTCYIAQKRRVHFHQFMLDVHKRIYDHKKFLLHKYGRDRHVNLSSSRDSIKHVAKEISKETKLLCFDEFQVTDIADAVILSKLFGELWSNGTVLVATSNRPPKDLYSDGLNRRDFLPFIEQLEKECLVRELNNEIDYRMSESVELQNTYFLTNTPETYQQLLELYEKEKEYFYSIPHQTISPYLKEVSQHPQTKEYFLPVSFNRSLSLKIADPVIGCCFVEFKDLCETDRGASDYKGLTKYFHSVYMYGIPKLSKLSHNSARRFIILVDELYNQNIRFLFTIEVEPIHLFEEEKAENNEQWQAIEQAELKDSLKIDEDEIKKYGRNYESNKAVERLSSGQQEEINVYEGELASIKELGFAFQRAASRLVELTSVQYHNRWKDKYFPDPMPTNKT